jgi:hypothetical protein
MDVLNSDRLSSLEIQIQLLQEELAEMETAKTATVANEKQRIQQKIDRQLLPELRKKRQEYSLTLARQTKTLETITEVQTQIVLTELIEELKLAAAHPTYITSEEQALLRQILLQLDQPETPASLKLKNLFPMPSFGTFSLETEGEQESFWYRNCPTFAHWVDRIKKKILPA